MGCRYIIKQNKNTSVYTNGTDRLENTRLYFLFLDSGYISPTYVSISYFKYSSKLYQKQAKLL